MIGFASTTGGAELPAGQALDAGLIQASLTPQAAHCIDRLTILHQVDSTNSWIKQQPEPGVLACLAEQQTGGRGRRGRQWSSPAGAGIWLSLRWPFAHPAAQLGLLSLRTGLAIRQAVTANTGLPVQLKWPNDLMLVGRKLAGILVELQSGGADQTMVIIGIGLNVRWPDAQPMPSDWADCRQAQPPVVRNQLAAAILNELVSEFASDAQPSACSVIARWWQHDMLAGQRVRVEHNGQRYLGRAAGIAADGAFVLDCDARLQHFHSSEVSIRLVQADA